MERTPVEAFDAPAVADRVKLLGEVLEGMGIRGGDEQGNAIPIHRLSFIGRPHAPEARARRTATLPRILAYMIWFRLSTSIRTVGMLETPTRQGLDRRPLLGTVSWEGFRSRRPESGTGAPG